MAGVPSTVGVVQVGSESSDVVGVFLFKKYQGIVQKVSGKDMFLLAIFGDRLIYIYIYMYFLTCYGLLISWETVPPSLGRDHSAGNSSPSSASAPRAGKR